MTTTTTSPSFFFTWSSRPLRTLLLLRSLIYEERDPEEMMEGEKRGKGPNIPFSSSSSFFFFFFFFRSASLLFSLFSSFNFEV